MHPYQLTGYPIGTVREMWALSWPLMLGLLSGSLMLFVDRLLLAQYSQEALNASTMGGLAYWLMLIVPTSICTISEVLAGRLHGEGRNREIGSAIWQMIFVALLFAPLLWAASIFLSPFIFYHSGNEGNETLYFQYLMFFSPLFCISIALSGFFIGIGKVHVVTFCTLSSNVINALLGYLLIFGLGPIPSLGIQGAAIAMGLSQLLLAMILFYVFWKKEHRDLFGTTVFCYIPTFFREGIKIGIPASLGHLVQAAGIFFFYRIVEMAGSDQLTLMGVFQSFYFLMMFVMDAECKAVGAITANLIGAKEYRLIGAVIRSGFILHMIITLLFASLLIFFPNELLGIFFTAESDKSELLLGASQAMLFFLAYLLLDGLDWIFVGFFTSAGDTKFIFYRSFMITWAASVIPAYLAVLFSNFTADVGWGILALSSFLSFSLYCYRWRSRRWMLTADPSFST